MDVIPWCYFLYKEWFYIESVLLGEANFTRVTYETWFRIAIRSLR